MYRRVFNARDDVPGRFAVVVEVAVRLGGFIVGFVIFGGGDAGSTFIPTPPGPEMDALLPPLVLLSPGVPPAGRFRFCPRAIIKMLEFYEIRLLTSDYKSALEWRLYGTGSFDGAVLTSFG